MTGHTPLPWKDGPVFNTDGKAIFFTDKSKPGKWQRRVDNKGGVFSPEDAAFIVKACNEYYILTNRILSLESKLAAFQGAA